MNAKTLANIAMIVLGTLADMNGAPSSESILYAGILTRWPEMSAGDFESIAAGLASKGCARRVKDETGRPALAATPGGITAGQQVNALLASLK